MSHLFTCLLIRWSLHILKQLKVNKDKYEVLRQFYDKIVIPELQTVPGCQFASLIQSSEDPEDFFP